MHLTTQTIPQGLCLEAILIVWDAKSALCTLLIKRKQTCKDR